MKIGFLGPKGTYSEEAARVYCPSAKYVPFNDFRSILEAIVNNEIEQGVLPAVNLKIGHLQGVFRKILEYSGRIQINDALVLTIRHALGALKGTTEIKEIFSKQEALEQCADFLYENYPGIPIIPVSSSAEAMKMIVESKKLGSAAIGREESLTQYGLNIIARDIVPDNKTLFYILGREQSKPTGNDTTIIAIHAGEDGAGLLYDMIKPFYDHRINMNSITSSRDNRGDLYFLIGLDGHPASKTIKDSLAEIEKNVRGTKVTVLGSHPSI